MKNEPHSTVSRRSLISAMTAGTVLLSSSGATSAQESTPESGEWTFTDDKGVTVTLPKRPTRIVADVNAAAPLWDFGIRPTALFGWNVMADGSFGDAGGRIDGEGIPIVGDLNETIRVEELLAVEPDVIVTLTWIPDDPDEYWSLDEDANAPLDQVREVAPIIAISATGLADENTLRFAELAEALGADLGTPEMVKAESDFQNALDNFETVAQDSTDLDLLFFYAVPEGAYIANPAEWADLNLYKALGMNILVPDVEEGEFWENLSHEQALKYPSDVIFSSSRGVTLSLQEIEASPTWGQHPAVSAGQIFPWNQDFIMSYQGMADALNGIANAVAESEKVTS